MQNEKPMPEKKTGHKRGERRRRRSYSRWKRKRRWWWWCGGGGERGRGGKENVVRVCVCVGPGCATRFESQRSEALRLQNGVKTR